MKPFTTAATVVFGVVALAQLVRVALRWEVTVNGFLIPPWPSLVAGGVAAVLAVMLWKENRP
jgi:hypothetical protein